METVGESVYGIRASSTSFTLGALYLIDDVDQPVGRSDVGCGDGGSTHDCDLREPTTKDSYRRRVWGSDEGSTCSSQRSEVRAGLTWFY